MRVMTVKLQRVDRHVLTCLPAWPLDLSVTWVYPTPPEVPRPAAVDRQVRQCSVDGRDRSDRPLGQMSDHPRGELVDLAVKGQLAPA